MVEAATRKAGWQVRRFDEMATMVNDRVDNPDAAGVDRYVGLEHLDSESLKIRRWGSPSDVTATKLRFREGDIIFGRRRVYQRKLAVADFDGICSAHAMVLRAKPSVVLVDFLPFFMQSDLFMERALEISVGSLSPTINWKTLAKQEFALPPLEEQRRMAEALRSIEAAGNRLFEARRQSELVVESLMHQFLAGLTDVRPFGDVVLKTEYGSSIRANAGHEGIPILRIPNILRGTLDLSDLKWASVADDQLEKYSVRPGDILMVRTNGNPQYVGRSVVVPQLSETMLFASYLIRIEVDRSRMRPEFAAMVLNSRTTRRLLRGFIRSSAGNYNINTKGIRSVSLPCPPLDSQDELLDTTQSLRSSRKALEQRRRSLHPLNESILEHIDQ